MIHQRRVPSAARVATLTVTIGLVVLACALFVLFSTPSHAEPEAPEITPTSPSVPAVPSLWQASPVYFVAGSGDTRIAVIGSDLHLAGSGAKIVWNGEALSTTRVELGSPWQGAYEAIVPGAWLSATGSASVTLRNDIGSSVAKTVFISDTAPAPPAPIALTMIASPGELSNSALANTIALTVTDANGAPAVSNTVPYLTASSGALSYDQLVAPGTFSYTHRYWPGLTSIVTPTIAITAFVLAPTDYATAVVTFTGTLTRELLYLPWVNRAPPTPYPTPTPNQSSVIYSGTIRINNIKSFGDPALNEADEYVEIENIGTRPVDVGGWQLNSVQGSIWGTIILAGYRFPPGTIIASDQICRIYTNSSGPYDCGLAPGFGAQQPIWPNRGSGVALLLNAAGTQMSSFYYQRYDGTPPSPAPFPTPTISSTPPPSSVIRVSRISYVGTAALNEGDEFVEIRNDGSLQVDLSNWSIKAFHGTQQVDSFVFDPGFIIAGGQACRIYTNLPAGPDNCGIADGFARDEPLWPNVPSGAYSARLYNAQNVEVARYTY